MDISKYELDISKHTYLRATQRNIDATKLEILLKNSQVNRFGKHGVKFVNKGRKRTIICVWQIVGTRIKIFTIEEK